MAVAWCWEFATAFRFFAKLGSCPERYLRNTGLKYVCKPVHIRVENAATPFTNACSQGEVLTIPIGHMEGNYFCDQPTLDELQREKRIVFRYATPRGEISSRANPNGSIDNIAGICSPGGNVLGMMPHPERASEAELGGTDGVKIFRSMVGAIAGATMSSEIMA